MATIKYTTEHEWLSIDGGVATVGITQYAQEQLGDVVFVELPDAGKELDLGEEAAVVESVKAAAEVLAPITGKILEVNEELAEDPSKVNSDAQGDGWFFKISIENDEELADMMDEGAYKAFVADLD